MSLFTHFARPHQKNRPVASRSPRLQAGRPRHQTARRYLAVELLEARALPSFLPPVFHGPFPSAGRVAVGDFNNDKIPDLVATSIDSTVFSVGVLLGKGDGTFQAPLYQSVGLRVGTLATGDFNGDGLLDIAVARVGMVPKAFMITVLLGNGDGSLQPPIVVGPSFLLADLAAGDFNGDGLTDLVTANGPLNTVSVRLGNGDGAFQDPVTYGTGAFARTVVVGDVSGDGVMDLVTNAAVLLGLGDGTFQDPLPHGGGLGTALALADLNTDGLLDLAGAIPESNTAVVLLGNGDGTFQEPLAHAVGTQPRSVAVGDFNGDGLPDLVTGNANSNDLSVLLGNGDGTFQDAQSHPLTNTRFVAPGDFNGDGFDDLAVTAESSVAVLLNDTDWFGPAPGPGQPLPPAWDGLALALSTALLPREEFP